MKLAYENSMRRQVKVESRLKWQSWKAIVD